MQPVSLTDFLDFVARTGSPRLTKVREVQRRDDYEPHVDFWKPLRDGIVRFHRNGSPSKHQLDALVTEATSKRRPRYAESIQGYKKFLGRKDVTWFKPPVGNWTQHGLRIRVNPELGLMVNGTRHIVKLYFKKKQLKKLHGADMIILLMHEALSRRVDGATRFAVLDVARGKLFSETSPSDELLPLLVGEAACFVSIWEDLQSV